MFDVVDGQSGHKNVSLGESGYFAQFSASGSHGRIIRFGRQFARLGVLLTIHFLRLDECE